MTDSTISNGYDFFHVELRLGYEAETEAQNIETPLLDGSLAVTLRPDLPRTGTLQFFFPDAATAHACRAKLVEPSTWTLVDTIDELNMVWVRHGRLGVVQQDVRSRWVLEVGFREVLA